jgi:hypothetical protein
VDKLRQKIEANVHVRGKDIHAEAVEPDMYAAIDCLADKLNRQVLKYKEKLSDHRADRDSIERQLTASAPRSALRNKRSARAYNRPVTPKERREVQVTARRFVSGTERLLQTHPR